METKSAKIHVIMAARIILKADVMTQSEIMFKELQWLSFTNPVHYHTYIMILKLSVNGQAPAYISSMFTKTIININCFILSLL